MDKIEKYLTEKRRYDTANDYEMEGNKYVGYDVKITVEGHAITMKPIMQKTIHAAPASWRGSGKTAKEAKQTTIEILQNAIKLVKKL